MKCFLLIDGGYLRATARAHSAFEYNPDFIEQFAKGCILADEYLVRTYYYDSPQFRGTVKLPVSDDITSFSANDAWLEDVSRREKFAVRRGTLGFRGWKPKRVPISRRDLKDSDFSPIFEQKGVDMRIGLDIALISAKKSVDRIILVSGDTDMIPAMKEARKAGIEVAIVQLPEPVYRVHKTLLSHSDYLRDVEWPPSTPATNPAT